MQAACGGWKRQKPDPDPHQSLQKEHTPANTLILAQWDPFWTTDIQPHKENSCNPMWIESQKMEKHTLPGQRNENAGFQKWESCWEWARHSLTCLQSTQDMRLTCLDNKLPLGIESLRLFKLTLDLIVRWEVDKPKLKDVLQDDWPKPSKTIKVTKDYKRQMCSRRKETKVPGPLHAYVILDCATGKEGSPCINWTSDSKKNKF